MKKLAKDKKKIFLIGILIVLVILILLFVKSFFAKQDRVYGNRLEGISKVEVSTERMNEMADVFKDIEGVTKTSARKNGKIIHVLVDVSSTTDFGKLKEASAKVVDSLNESQRNFYDIELFFFGEGDTYPVIGYLHKGGKDFVWSNNVNN